METKEVMDAKLTIKGTLSPLLELSEWPTILYPFKIDLFDFIFEDRIQMLELARTKLAFRRLRQTPMFRKNTPRPIFSSGSKYIFDDN